MWCMLPEALLSICNNWAIPTPRWCKLEPTCTGIMGHNKVDRDLSDLSSESKFLPDSRYIIIIKLPINHGAIEFLLDAETVDVTFIIRSYTAIPGLTYDGASRTWNILVNSCANWAYVRAVTATTSRNRLRSSFKGFRVATCCCTAIIPCEVWTKPEIKVRIWISWIICILRVTCFFSWILTFLNNTAT